MANTAASCSAAVPFTYGVSSVSFGDSCSVSAEPQSSAKELRKQAKAVEKHERKAKANAKAYKAQVKRQTDDRETVRANLLRVVQDESKGYASVQAAEALSTLGFI